MLLDYTYDIYTPTNVFRLRSQTACFSSYKYIVFTFSSWNKLSGNVNLETNLKESLISLNLLYSNFVVRIRDVYWKSKYQEHNRENKIK